MVANRELALEELERLFRNADPEPKDRMTATAAETWMKRSGMAGGKAEPLPRLTERRFGAVPEAVRAQVSAAPIADLDGWIDAILDAGDVDEVFVNGLAHQACPAARIPRRTAPVSHVSARPGRSPSRRPPPCALRA